MKTPIVGTTVKTVVGTLVLIKNNKIKMFTMISGTFLSWITTEFFMAGHQLREAKTVS